VNPATPEYQTANPDYRIWLHTALRKTLEAIPGSARHGAERSARRVLAHVETAQAHGRGLAIYAAPAFGAREWVPLPRLPVTPSS
jgi:hypothetical protein